MEAKEKLLKTASNEKEQARIEVKEIKGRSSRVTRDLKNQLRHDRLLKNDAFHQVDELLAQVRPSFFTHPHSQFSHQPQTPHTLTLYTLSHPHRLKSILNRRMLSSAPPSRLLATPP